MQEQLDAQRASLKEGMQGHIEGKLASDLEPVEGVSMETWAGGMARVAQGAEQVSVIAELGIDGRTWERASAEWSVPTPRDTTATLATVYGRAIRGAGAGPFGATQPRLGRGCQGGHTPPHRDGRAPPRYHVTSSPSSGPVRYSRLPHFEP